jgi:predicted amino acid-binding ACT domain protein
LKLALVGHDRIGIVREVSQVLARHAVNVEKLETHTASAPMSAETLFHCPGRPRGSVGPRRPRTEGRTGSGSPTT